MCHPLWLALEELVGGQASLWEWRRRLGDGIGALQSLLIPVDRTVESLPDPEDPYGTYRLVDNGARELVGIHERNNTRIAVTRADAVIYRLSTERLIGKLVKAYGFHPITVVSDVNSLTSQIALFRPYAGYEFVVFLSLPIEEDDLRRSIYWCLSQCNRPFVVSCPTSSLLTPDVESMLRVREACFIPMNEAVEICHRGDWRATAFGKKTIDGFRSRVTPQPTATEAPLVFFPTPSDSTWANVRIKFLDGETVSATVGDVSQIVNFTSMGMVDARSGKVTKQWELLRTFARNSGFLTWKNSEAHRHQQKRCQTLSKNLRQFFRIDGHPIVYNETVKGWKTAFHVEPDSA